MFNVYHINEERFRDFLQGKACVFPDDFELVARVDNGDIEQAYLATKVSFDEAMRGKRINWWSDPLPEVQVVKKSRNSFIGTVMEDLVSTRFHLITLHGEKEIYPGDEVSMKACEVIFTEVKTIEGQDPRRKLVCGIPLPENQNYVSAWGCECSIVDGWVDISKDVREDFTEGSVLPEFFHFVKVFVRPWIEKEGPKLKRYQNTSIYNGLCRAMMMKKESDTVLYTTALIHDVPKWAEMKTPASLVFQNQKERDIFMDVHFSDRTWASTPDRFITNEFVMVIPVDRKMLKVVPPTEPEARGMYQVYHLSRTEHMKLLLEGGEVKFPEDYQKVAQVFCDDLSYAHTATCHIDQPWWRNSGVHLIKMTKKSTSVGDVIMAPRGMKIYLVTDDGYMGIEQRSIITREMFFRKRQYSGG